MPVRQVLPVVRPVVPAQLEMGEVQDETIYQGKIPRPQVQQNQVVKPRVVEHHLMILVNRQQDADQIVD